MKGNQLAWLGCRQSDIFRCAVKDGGPSGLELPCNKPGLRYCHTALVVFAAANESYLLLGARVREKNGKRDRTLHEFYHKGAF